MRTALIAPTNAAQRAPTACTGAANPSETIATPRSARACEVLGRFIFPSGDYAREISYHRDTVARYITFRFDDGFIEGARKADAILHPSRATFFLTTGLVSRSIPMDSDPMFKDRDFGTIEEWRAIASLGHDVQLHSVSHPNFRNICEEQQKLEVLGSLASIREIHSGPFVFAFPYNAISNINLSKLGISAAGFLTHSSDQDVIFNNIEDLESNIFQLRSWAVRERHYLRVVDQLDGLPENSWTILAFHSLDGEGHEPWTSEGFMRLVEFVRAAAFRVVSVVGALQTLTQRTGINLERYQ